MSDEKHKEFRRLGSVLIEKNPKVFQPLLVLFELCTQQQILSTCFISPDHTDFVKEFEMDKRNLFYT